MVVDVDNRCAGEKIRVMKTAQGRWFQNVDGKNQVGSGSGIGKVKILRIGGKSFPRGNRQLESIVQCSGLALVFHIGYFFKIAQIIGAVGDQEVSPGQGGLNLVDPHQIADFY